MKSTSTLRSDNFPLPIPLPSIQLKKDKTEKAYLQRLNQGMGLTVSISPFKCIEV